MLYFMTIFGDFQVKICAKLFLGGPLLKTDYTNLPIRIVQHGILHGGVEECHHDRYPGIYTRVDNEDVWSFIMFKVFEVKPQGEHLVLRSENRKKDYTKKCFGPKPSCFDIVKTQKTIG